MSVSAARRNHRSSSQYDVVNPIEHRTNLADAGTVNNGRLPHGDEVWWQELIYQVRHGFAQQVTVAGGVYAGVVSRGLDPKHVGNGDKENPLLVLHHKAFQRAETSEGLQQWFETSICFPALFEDLACVSQGLGKSLLIIRFQEIVNCVHFECANGVHIVSCDKDIYGSGAVHWFHIFDDSKTIQIRHLHIEKNDVRVKFIDLLHRAYAVRCLAYNFNAVVSSQIATDTAPGDRFVIDDEDSRLQCELRSGMVMMASQPRPSPPVSSSDDSSPYSCFKRDRTLVSPTPKRRRDPGAGPGPSSRTQSRTLPLWSLAVISSRPAAESTPIPCLMAFSTSG